MLQLKPLNIFCTKDKIVFVKETRFYETTFPNSNGPGTVFWGRQGLISVYDKQMHLLHEEKLEKSVQLPAYT